MSLLFPFGLLGLFSLPVIIGLHLYFERNRREVVSSLFLWAFLDPKFQGSQPRRIRLSWVLLLDLLVAVFISVALAQPQVKLPASFGQDYQLVILLDNSTSMLASDAQPSRFEAAKSDIVGLIDRTERYTSVAVITVGNREVIVGDSNKMTKQELKERIGDISAGGTGTSIRSGLALAESLIGEKNSLEIHVFTDGAFDLDDIEDFDFPIEWHFYGDGAPNLSINQVQLLEIGEGNYQLYANLQNHSGVESNPEVKVLVDGEEIGRTKVQLQQDSVFPFSLSLIGHVDYVLIEFVGGDALPEDNFAGAASPAENVIRAALVTNQPDPLDRALLAIPDLELTVIDPVKYRPGMIFDLTVFQNYLPNEWPDGGKLVFDPPAGADLLSVSGITLIDQPLEVFPHPITDGLFFSGVRWQEARDMPNWQSNFSPLITAGDTPVMLQAELDTGKLIIFLPELTAGNITLHPAFPLLISNVVEGVRSYQPEQVYMIGEQIKFPANYWERVISFEGPAGPAIKTYPAGGLVLSQFGRYQIVTSSDVGGPEMVSFAVNAGDPEESDLRVREWVDSVADFQYQPLEDRKVLVNLSPWLLGAALILLLMEAWRAWR